MFLFILNPAAPHVFILCANSCTATAPLIHAMCGCGSRTYYLHISGTQTSSNLLPSQQREIESNGDKKNSLFYGDTIPILWKSSPRYVRTVDIALQLTMAFTIPIRAVNVLLSYRLSHHVRDLQSTFSLALTRPELSYVHGKFQEKNEIMSITAFRIVLVRKNCCKELEDMGLYMGKRWSWLTSSCHYLSPNIFWLIAWSTITGKYDSFPWTIYLSW